MKLYRLLEATDTKILWFLRVAALVFLPVTAAHANGVIPEPPAMALLALGGAAVGIITFLKRRKGK